MARDSRKPPLRPLDGTEGHEGDNDTRVAARPNPTPLQESEREDGETRVGPSPFAMGGKKSHGAPATQPQGDIETKIAPSPLAGSASDFQGAETRVATLPAEFIAKARPPAAPEGQTAPQWQADAPADPQASAGSDARAAAADPSAGPPREITAPSGLPRPSVDGEADDSTRVGPLPSGMSARPEAAAPRDAHASHGAFEPPAGASNHEPIAPQAAPASQSMAMPKHERRNIPSVDLPADLRLPTFDFKASDSPDVAAAKAAGAHVALPSHVKLPTFPELGKPPVPKQEVSVPPPMPKKAAPPPLPPVSAPAEPVLDLSLPEFTPRPTQRNLTLIGSGQQAQKAFTKRVIWPTVVALVFVSVSVGLFLAREQVVSMLAPKHAPPVPPPPTPQERAKTALAAGGMAYVAKDYKVAIRQFEAALVDDPRLVEAHRSLGIVYATLHDQAKAVRHYQDYLALSPHAPDAADVQKIIDDYKHAQAKAAAAAQSPAPEQKHHKPPARGRRR